jgi:transcriptional regulator
VNDAPREYTQAMLGAIVGLEIEITKLQGKFKLSQNRAPVDQKGVLAGAAQGAEDERLMAQAMAKVVPGLGGA